MTKKSFSIPVRVYYEDTDAGGIVYHSNYLKFAERGRTEYLRALGFDHGRVQDEHNVLFIVRHAAIDYKASARLDDLLEVRSEVSEIGNTSMTMRQEVLRDGKLLADIKIVLVTVTPEGKPVRIAPQLRQIFAG